MASQFSTSNRASEASSLTIGRVFTVGLISVAAAVIANLIVRFLLIALLDLNASFQPLGVVPIVIFTAAGTFLGVLVLAMLTRISQNPIRTYTIVAIVALVLSLLPNLAFMANPAAAPMPGGSGMDFGVLIIFHIVAFVTHIAVIHRLRLG